VRGTPLPVAAFLGGRILQAVIVAVILVVLVLVVGLLLYGVELDGDRVPALAVSLVIGAATFCALGLAISGFVPDADAAPAVVNISILPLLFISDIFIPTVEAPAWLNNFASLFPVYHFARAMHAVFNPFLEGDAFQLKALLVMAGWGIGAVVVSLRFFSWEPRS
jgi:ABC-2 type transport system permease protein